LNTLGFAVPEGMSILGFLVAVGGAVVLIIAMGMIRR